MSALQTIREPALLIRNPLETGGGTASFYFFKDGCTLKPVQPRFDIMIEGQVFDTRPESQVWEINGRLTGNWENFAILFPHLSANLGASLLGATDVMWRLITASGRQWTFYRAAITKRPSLMAKVGDTLLGDFTLTAVHSTEEGGTLAYATGQTHPGFAAFSDTSILTLAPEVDFGSDAFDEMWPTDGVEIDFAWTLEPVLYNRQIIDWTIKSQDITAKLKPQNDATWSDWMTKLGLDIAMGASPPVANLSVFYNGFYVQLYNAQCQLDQFNFKHDANFIEGITARVMQRFAGGSAQPLAYVGTSD
jgi:hypothetical protein